jgi:hypothetical protein
MLATIAPAAAQGLSEAKAREIIAPWYSLFNVATRGDGARKWPRCGGQRSRWI